MRFGAWHFCPGRASTIAVLLLLPVLLMLGYWQLDRAAQKAELQTTFAKRFAQPPVDLTGVDPADSSNRYLHVVASGRYDGAHQMLLDNQVHDGQPGYHVLTPLRMAGDAILIDRGWVPLGESRQVLPDIGASTDDITIGGWLAQPRPRACAWAMRLELTSTGREWCLMSITNDYPQSSDIRCNRR